MILERVKERGFVKLLLAELIDSSLGRSEYQTIHAIRPFIVTEQDELSFPASALLPRLMEFKLGRSIITVLQHPIPDITVVVELLNALSPREIVVSLGRSIHSG